MTHNMGNTDQQKRIITLRTVHQKRRLAQKLKQNTMAFLERHGKSEKGYVAKIEAIKTHFRQMTKESTLNN